MTDPTRALIVALDAVLDPAHDPERDERDELALWDAARAFAAWLDSPDSWPSSPSPRDALAVLAERLALVASQPDPRLGLVAQLIGLSAAHLPPEPLQRALDALVALALLHVQSAAAFSASLRLAQQALKPEPGQDLDAAEAALMQDLTASAPDQARAWRLAHAAMTGLELALCSNRALGAPLEQRHPALIQALREHLSDHGPSARVLTLLHMIHDEEVLVLLADTQRGFLVHLDGVTDTPQLHGLLMHALAPELGLEPLDPEALSVLDGSGPHFTGAWLQGVWTLWSADALGGASGLELDPGAPPHHQIAALAVPGLAPRRQGRLVFVLAPPESMESWTLFRRFVTLRASASLRRALTPQELSSALNP